MKIKKVKKKKDCQCNIRPAEMTKSRCCYTNKSYNIPTKISRRIPKAPQEIKREVTETLSTNVLTKADNGNI